MAVPKRKQTPSRTGMRRAQNMKFSTKNIVEDKMLSSIKLHWKELLTESDIEKLNHLKFTNEFNILIGTTFFEHSQNFIPFLKDKFDKKITEYARGD